MIKLSYFILFIFVFSISLWACTGNKKSTFKTVTSDQFEDLINETNGIQLVDVRTAEEYSINHLEGSINLDVNSDSFIDDAKSVLSKSKPVAVYCKSGRRSRNASEQLSKEGYKVYNLDKGIEGWVEEGKYIEVGD